MENPHEERQSLLLERIIKNVDLLNESLLDLDRSVAEINAHNSSITIVAELWEGYRRNVAFNLQNMDEAEKEEAEKAKAESSNAQGNTES